MFIKKFTLSVCNSGIPRLWFVVLIHALPARKNWGINIANGRLLSETKRNIYIGVSRLILECGILMEYDRALPLISILNGLRPERP